MKRNKLIAKMLLIASIAQVPNMSNALDIKYNDIKKGIVIKDLPSQTFVTQYDFFNSLYTIAFGEEISEATISVTKDGVLISQKVIDIQNGDVIEYDFKDETAGEYEITIVTDNGSSIVEHIYVQ